jgi:acetyl esterase/lipase
VIRKKITCTVGLCLAVFLAILVPASSDPTACRQIDLSYGPHSAQILDLYTPCHEGTFPAVIYIHGGGWWSGDKAYFSQADIDFFLSRNIALASINYRNLDQARTDGLFPPVYGPLVDARSAVGFLQAHARKLHLDPRRMATYGGSAGGFSALWVGLGAGMTDLPDFKGSLPKIEPMKAIGGVDAQTTIDPIEMRDWVSADIAYGGHAFGLAENEFDRFLRNRDQYQAYIPKISPSDLVGAGAPPLYLIYSAALDSREKDHNSLVHDPRFGIEFGKLAEKAGVSTVVFGNARNDATAMQGLMHFLARSLGEDR